MNNFEGLNFYQRYKRAIFLSRNTSRMNNVDWYKKALELDSQLHLYTGKTGLIEAYLFIKSQNYYEKLADINEGDSEKNESLKLFINQLLEHEKLEKIKSLGVVLYVADELSIASLGPEHQNSSELDNLKKQVIDEPGAILEDKTVSVDSHSWRIFPYRGAISGSEFATTIVVSRKYAKMMSLFREIGDNKNFPIVTSVLSAPICAVASMPWFSEPHRNGVIAVYNYSNFTLLAFFNAAGDLMMLRNMLHPLGSDFPVNIGSAMAATSSAFELEGPEINVISMVGNDPRGLIASIQSGMKASELMLIDPREILISRQLPPNIPLEMLVTTQGGGESVLASNTTFSDFEENEWHLQEFVIPAAEELEMYPSLGEMKLLRLGKIVKIFGAVAVLLLASWLSINIWKKTKTESWTCKPESQKLEIAGLQKKINTYSHYDNLFKDRSKAWVCMELVTKVAPVGVPVHLKSVNHEVDSSYTKGDKKIGLKKTWVITGFTNEQGLVYLESISTKIKIKEVFDTVAKLTDNSAYLTNIEGREILVDIQNSINRDLQRGSNENDWPLGFTMNIIQTLPAGDAMGIVASK